MQRAKTIADFLSESPSRKQVIRVAYRADGIKLSEMTAEAGISRARVGQWVSKAEAVEPSGI
jgi:hypothetical protein